MSTQITFVRHGTTEHNAKGAYSGSSDLPLNENGVEMAQNAGEQLADEQFDVMLYGHMLRVQQTAEVVLNQLATKPCVIKQMREIKEIDFGRFEGLTYLQIEQQYPQDWQNYMENWREYTFPAGDSIPAFYSHCAEFGEWVQREYAQKNILLVGHKGFIAAVMSSVLHEGLDAMMSRNIPHAQPLRLEIKL